MEAKVIKTNFQALLSLIFPMRCIGCDSVIEPTDLLCTSCQFGLDYTGFAFDNLNPMNLQLSELCRIEKATALLQFSKNGLTQKLLHQLKYRGKPQIGNFMAKLVLNRFEPKLFSAIDCIVPIPIHKKKIKQRGYNQIMSFAKTISRRLDIHLNHDSLIRIKNNPSQVTKNRAKRLNTLKDSFALKNHSQIENKHILLVDDIMTTGATISICTKLLTSQTNVKVSVITIAFA